MTSKLTFAAGLIAAAGFFAAGLFVSGSATALQDGGDDLVPKRIDRAKRIVPALEAALDRAKTADPVESLYMKQLTDALDDAKALTKPTTLGELTDEEREALAEEIRGGGLGGGESDGLNAWQRRALARSFEGAELTEEQERDATPIISDWFTASWEARAAGDSKAQSDLKKKRDKELADLLGKKKARKLINNLNSMGGRGR